MQYDRTHLGRLTEWSNRWRTEVHRKVLTSLRWRWRASRPKRRRLQAVLNELHHAVRSKPQARVVVPPVPSGVMLFAIPLFVTGAFYTVLFVPLTVSAAARAGLDPIGVLLLQDAPTTWLNESLLIFPPWSDELARPSLYAWGVLYGAIGFVAAVMFLTGGLVRLAIASSGVYAGFFLTRWTAIQLGVLPADAFDDRVLYFKLGYVLLSFYLASALTSAIARDELSRVRYEFLFTGSQAIAAGYILGRGFGPHAAVFAGMLYVVCCFVTLTAAEIVGRRVVHVAKVLSGEPDHRLWRQFEDDRAVSCRQLRKAVVRGWRQNQMEITLATLLFLIWPIGIAMVRTILFG